MQATDVLYLAGTAQSAHLVVPADGEAALLVRRSLDRARAESPLERIEPLRSLRELGPALAGAGVAGGRLGLELDVVPAALYLDYGRRLEGFELGDCSPIVRRLRSVKSPWELARVEEAGALLARVHEQVGERVVEGMTELELAAEIERLLRREGHQGVSRFRAFNQESIWCSVLAGGAVAAGGSDAPFVGEGPSLAVPHGAGHARVRRAEPIVVDLIGTSAGYLADQTRMFSVGPLGEPYREAFEHARAILHAVAEEARPGIAWGALHARAVELAGDRPRFMGGSVSFVGHGVGLEVDEPPYLARGFEQQLEPGMVFALEPKFVLDGGGVGIEHTYVVEVEGVRAVTPAPEDVVEVDDWTDLSPRRPCMNDEITRALQTIFNADSELYQSRGFQRRVGFGERPALIHIDLANAWTRPGHAFSCDGMDMIIPGVQRLNEAGARRASRSSTRRPRTRSRTARTATWASGTTRSRSSCCSSARDAVAIDERIAPEPGEQVIVKKRASAFHGTNLAGYLRAHGVDTVIITGVTMAGCVRHTTEDAIAEGFRPIVVRECVGDRVAGVVEWNLFDIDAKFGDVEPLERVLEYLGGVAHFSERSTTATA